MVVSNNWIGSEAGCNQVIATFYEAGVECLGRKAGGCSRDVAVACRLNSCASGAACLL